MLSVVLCAAEYPLSTVLAVTIVFLAMIGTVAFNTVYFRRRYFSHKYKIGEESDRIWSPDDEFDIEKDVLTVEKTPGKDFVILTFPDIQIWQPFRLGKKYVVYNTIKNTVRKTDPDMIVLLGDNAFYYSRQCYERLAEIMEEIGKPWTFVFGNHDKEGNADLPALADIFMKEKHCIFSKGPRNLNGIGNFAINVTEKGKIIHTMFFFDSGDAGFVYDEKKVRYLKADKEMKEKMPAYYVCRIHEGEHKGEVPVGEDWGTFSYDQVQYYRWLLAGIAKANGGKKPESSMFFHMAFYEFNDAYFDWVENGCDPNVGFGELNVKIGSASVPSGMFDAITEEGSTKNVIVGHEHENTLSLLYKGVRLSYAVKCGDECTAFAEKINGGSTLSIDSDGRGKNYANVYVPLEGKRHYDKMMWYYYNLDMQKEKEWSEIEAAEEKAKEADDE